MNGSPAKKSGMSVVTIIIIAAVALILVIVAVVGIGAAISIYGARRYIGEAKKSEGKLQVSLLARGIATCGDAAGGKLPASSPPVPASLADVSGKKYMSAPSDWTDPAFSCATFSMSTPQYFQYQWESTSPSSGTARGLADFDGDGKTDAKFEVSVTCSGASCTAGQLVEHQ